MSPTGDVNVDANATKKQPPNDDGDRQDGDDDNVLYEESYRPPFLIALVLLPPLLPLFWTYRVKVTTTTLRFGYTYGLTSKTTSRSVIRNVQVIKEVHGLRDWGGWGIRGNWASGKFEWGYISKNGPGIRVTLALPPASSSSKSNKMSGGDEVNEEENLVSYTFLCNDAERVAKILSPCTSSAAL